MTRIAMDIFQNQTRRNRRPRYQGHSRVLPQASGLRPVSRAVPAALHIKSLELGAVARSPFGDPLTHSEHRRFTSTWGSSMIIISFMDIICMRCDEMR